MTESDVQKLVDAQSLNSSGESQDRLRSEVKVTRRTALISSCAGVVGWGLLQVGTSDAALPQRERPRPGSIELSNGMIFSGLCGADSTLAPRRLDQSEVDRPDQKLLLRAINQGSREVFVHVKNSQEPVFDNAVWPSLTFKVPQKRQTRKPLPQGFPVVGAFDQQGIAKGKIVGGPKGDVALEAGITNINELFAEVTSLTHDWSYSIATNSLPPETLLGVIRKVEGYENQSVRRLELIRMLIRADRLAEAAMELREVQNDFPDVAREQEEFQQSLREQIARQILDALEKRRATGQHQLASNGARSHTRQDLTPETIVRINKLVSDYDEIFRRINAVKSSIMTLTAELKDDKLRAEAGRISVLVSEGVDPDSIDRFAAFELLMPAPPAEAEVKDADGEAADGEASDELLAMAFSGWLMGADQTVRSLTEVVSLFEARQTILDYLDTESDEVDHRRELADRVRKLEGVSVDRVAAIIRHLPSVQTIGLGTEVQPGSAREFRIEPTEGMAGCLGLVPPDYHETRNYPTLIAFPPEFGTIVDYLSFWKSSCERHGYIVVVPFWEAPAIDEADGGNGAANADPAALRYDASALRHRQLMALVRRLKRGLRVDDDAVFVAGHAQGGEIAMDMVTSHPDLFAGVTSVCGMTRRHFLFTLGNAIDVPWYVVVGDSQAGWFEQTGPLAARLFKRDAESERYFETIFVKHLFRGVSFYPEEREDQFKWMARQRRKARLEKFTAKVLRSTDLAWSWVKLDSLPEKFAQLDTPTDDAETRFVPADLTIRTTERNQILIQSAPTGVSICLSPTMAKFDLAKPIRIEFGREKLSVDYAPSINHMLEEFYETADRTRLCYQKMHIDK